MPSAPPASEPARRNPGPSWGYRFLRATDAVLPEFIHKPLRAAGTFVAMLFMPAQRRHSREYLALVLPRAPTWRDTFRHFFAFEEMLMTKLRLIDGQPFREIYAPSCPDDLRRWRDSSDAALLGAFHIGITDLHTSELGLRGNHRIFIMRERVGNSHDTDKLAERFGDRVRFIWVNDPGEMIFALKEAAAGPDASIALECDRLRPRARAEAFDFLGARRLFPGTIYFLAALFRRPVILCFVMPGGPGTAVLYSSPRLDIAPGESRESVLARGHAHFQDFLRVIETQLRANPYLWFNFTPMNPPAP